MLTGMGGDIIFLAVVAAVLATTLSADVPYTIVNVACLKGNNCPSAECCVFDKEVGHGVCKPMGRTGSECHTLQPYASERPEEMVTDYDRCPCQSGELCLPIDSRELGICSFG